MQPRGEPAARMPPYMPWDAFKQFFGSHWQAGEHVSLVAQTGSGKSTLAVELYDLRTYVVVLRTKLYDDTLDKLITQKGYKVTETFDPRNWDAEQYPKVMFWCPLADTSLEAEARQREQIRTVLRGVYITGGWTVGLDEVAYLSKDLKLDRELNAIWREGRSAHTTLIAGTQRPVNVPRNMWEMATHNFDWKVTGRDDRKTASEYLGDQSGIAFEVMGQLPRHEFLYVDSIESIAIRSRVGG